jgi:uncharacterized protein (TIGR00304 family)
MNKYYIGAGICFVIASICFSWSFGEGDGSSVTIIVFPFFVGNSWYAGIGGLFLCLAFIFVFMGFFSGYELLGWREMEEEFFGDERSSKDQSGQPQVQRKRRTRVQGGGVILIGPIPIIFGSNTKLTVIIVALTLAIMVVAFMFFMIL